ncbi:putative gustatory receptor 28b [Musca domestica]|uniref:Gustatory receptor 28b n=1 Tax=Musca domestica TaxID=7370 RepID=A0A9J7D575_MUSDO|nr:putative gustatory receptor 28b [Musca domestica]
MNSASRLERLRQCFISHQVFEALQPLFLITFLYGLTPFRVAKNNKGVTTVQMSFFGFINIALYILLYGACYIVSLLQDETVVGYFFRTKISNVGNTLQICNGLITGAVIYISAVTQRRKLLRVCEILYNLDENFANIGIKVKYSRIYRFSIVMIIFKILVIGCYFAGVLHLLKSLGITPSFSVCVTFFLQHSVLSIAICLFCFVARSFERRLVIVNKVGMDTEVDNYYGTQNFENKNLNHIKLVKNVLL